MNWLELFIFAKIQAHAFTFKKHYFHVEKFV